MKAASLHEIKKELEHLTPKEVFDLCIRLAKYKKENKELLNYLLFEAHDEAKYIENIKKEVDVQFEDVNTSQVFFAKKTIRKILRNVNKHIKYSGQKQTEVELLIYFCKKMKQCPIPFKKYLILLNLYERQITKIEKALVTLHEDLQFDYRKDFEDLQV